MSSQSSGISHDHYDDDHDEVCSCDTYSSGWERSSSSEYFEDTETDIEEDFMDDGIDANRPFYVPYKKTGKPTLFDMDYKLELVALSHPYNKNKPIQDNTTTTVLTDTTSTITPESTPVMEIVANPWKKINQDTTENTPPEDPWKFLDDLNKPLYPKQQPHKENNHREQNRNDRNKAHHRDRDQDRDKERRSRTTTSRPIDNSDTNKLCKYKNECRMNKNNNCSMVHALTAWKPRICRFNTSCKKKTSCGYYHTDVPLAEYLKIMMKTKDTIYAKNYAFYEKYLK